MSEASESGVVLTVDANDIDEVAVRIAAMWTRYNDERRAALLLGEEARRFVFATDVNQTSAVALPHKNRTHQPKLTQISDNLQSQYFEASLSMPQFFIYETPDPKQADKARKVEAWVRTKLEQKKFRETTGRALLADYVNYGNCFASIDYKVELDDNGKLAYKGIIIERVSPMDIVFNPRAESFSKSPKLQRKLVHVAEIAAWPESFPKADFKQGTIAKALQYRQSAYVNDWVEVLKERGLNMDGFGSYDEYFKSDMAEVLIYRGDIYDPATGKTERNRVVYILDRAHVIRNAPSRAPTNFDGIHHAGWRVRNDNLWAQGPLDNLIGLQYRIDHLENLKADVFDLIAHPVIKIKGDEVSEPEGGYRPGATYYCGVEGDVEMVVPNATVLNADNQIATYHRLMETFAGAPPETQGIRTPGEKTAFEVNTLNQNATMMFVDKARNFERMLETLLKEAFELMLLNFDGADFVEMFNDITGEMELKELSLQDVNARGTFTAVGARFWSRRNRETVELNNFINGPMKDPKIRAHVNGFNLASHLNKKLNIEDAKIIEAFAGVKEDVQIQAIAQAEGQRFQENAGDIGLDEKSAVGAPVPIQQGSGEGEAGM